MRRYSKNWTVLMDDFSPRERRLAENALARVLQENPQYVSVIQSMQVSSPSLPSGTTPQTALKELAEKDPARLKREKRKLHNVLHQALASEELTFTAVFFLLQFDDLLILRLMHAGHKVTMNPFVYAMH